MHESLLLLLFIALALCGQIPGPLNDIHDPGNDYYTCPHYSGSMEYSAMFLSTWTALDQEYIKRKTLLEDSRMLAHLLSA